MCELTETVAVYTTPAQTPDRKGLCVYMGGECGLDVPDNQEAVSTSTPPVTRDLIPSHRCR